MKPNGIAGDKAAYYPTSGYRSIASGAIYNERSNGYYWSASPFGASHGYSLVFSSDFATLQYLSFRGSGYPGPLRPRIIRERSDRIRFIRFI